MTTPIAAGLVDVTVGRQRCTNCAHTKCMFHGEDRLPMYRGLSHQRGTYCWIDPESEFGQSLTRPN
jgi:hypothetical protein